MALEIQGAVNSMIGSVGSVIQQNEENKRKALNIALGAVTGGVGGAAVAAAKQAGVNPKAVGQLTNTAVDTQGDTPVGQVQMSPQQQASQQAMQNMQNEVQSKKAQKDEFANMQTSLGKFSDLPEDIQKRIREEYEKNGRN